MSKALIRSGEVYPESAWTDWTRANLGREIEINGWALMNDYTEVADGVIYDVAVYPEPEDPADDNVQDTIVIDGITYTRTS